MAMKIIKQREAVAFKLYQLHLDNNSEEKASEFLIQLYTQ
jgi:hypothetical protein